MVDWTTIRQEYEAGDSLRVLSARHGVPTTTLHRRMHKEQWNKPAEHISGTVEQSIPPTADAVAIANALLSLLLEHVGRKDLDLKAIKSISDSLSSCQRVIIAAGPAAQEPRHSYLAPEFIAALEPGERDHLQAIFAQAEARLREQADEKITPIRKV